MATGRAAELPAGSYDLLHPGIAVLVAAALRALTMQVAGLRSPAPVGTHPITGIAAAPPPSLPVSARLALLGALRR